MDFETIAGFYDSFGADVRLYSFIEAKASEQFQLFGYQPIKVPLLEKTMFFSEEIVGTSPWPEWNER